MVRNLLVGWLGWGGGGVGWWLGMRSGVEGWGDGSFVVGLGG